MQLPFTHDQFLDVFGAFNTTLWPAAAVLWVVTVGVILAFHRRGEAASRWVAGLLAVHWAWSGIAYHLVYFRPINPAAALFGALFIVEAVALFWLGVRTTRLRFSSIFSGWGRIGVMLILYALPYPLLGALFGLKFPRLPLFGVPCPTTILTIGLLLCTTSRVTRWLAIVPILWAAIGGSAAFVFGIRADFALLIAGLLLLLFIGVRRGDGRTAPDAVSKL